MEFPSRDYVREIIDACFVLKEQGVLVRMEYNVLTFPSTVSHHLGLCWKNKREFFSFIPCTISSHQFHLDSRLRCLEFEIFIYFYGLETLE